jgi:hypothetical protein
LDVIKELVLMMVRLRSAMVRCHPGRDPEGTYRPEGLPGVGAHVAAAPGDGEDEALGPQDVDGTQHGIPADAVLLLELLDGRQRTCAPFTLRDLGPQNA